ncbi:MAG: 2,3-bisphosphoglycerate-independent phosphoglycerate mutase [Candidatus Moranbacteria bacterium CG_4_10_14_3_um_filter_44_15]|nr:MAG: 2,3-bisphosphoglycerate-independent phosphoglycerate mutase [Candidatus Moranbacteria bacterium CG06_land_8_20_14_3_00_43_56]PIX90639.1 MAG: 2,3-bisphosphoglycerate-independent phosphoglycerate mutase [Candidatus Moranbacteria bacterium CG_4_10_14_3_um_filter_44_15]PJA85534.1 MAG: 2,3-bisphosphoglycerate-independent phosphoglycerate mutase [Candidatus Moranbacteria bacterium CG_4_9_14_3_um_filter_44_28]
MNSNKPRTKSHKTMEKIEIIPKTRNHGNLVRGKPTILAILDGWGIGLKDKTNAIWLAKTPAFDYLSKKYPFTQLGATGSDVGLENNQTSGSETGHMNIGAGRIAEQDSRVISESINSGAFFHNPAFLGAISHVRKNKSDLHLMGLLGNEDSPHMSPYHLEALLILAKKNGIKNVYIHFFTDGRDSYPKSAIDHIRDWKERIYDIGVGKIATLVGRFYAMDRAKNWKRLKVAYELLVKGKGRKFKNAEHAVRENYKNEITDEYIKPSVITGNGEPIASIKDNDAVIFYNLRSDRARQFSKLFVQEDSDETKLLLPRLKNLYFVAMTNFGPDLPVHTAYYGHPINGTLPVAFRDIRQFYIAETEKFAHVTYFLNGGYADPIAGEDRLMVPSPVIDSYAKKPEMSAEKITEQILKSIKAGKYDFITVNYANADMVGHTGNIKAAVKAVEAVDKCLAKLYKEINKRNGSLIITADHGNADCMWDKKAKLPMTFHTKNPVPFITCVNKLRGKRLKSGGILGNIAPTLCDAMNIDKLKEMKLKSLL